MVTTSVEVLLSAYTALKREKELAISTHLQQMQQQAAQLLPTLLEANGSSASSVLRFDRLYEQVMAHENSQELMGQPLRQQAQAMQAQELTIAHAQAALLDQLRSYLAADARSLLFTSDFQAFARLLCKQAGLKLIPVPAKWVLPTLQYPLQIQSLEAIAQAAVGEAEVSTVFALQLQVGLGQWQQLIMLPTAMAQTTVPMRYRAAEVIEQWHEANRQLQPTPQQWPIARSRQHKLVQELAIVLTYAATTFDCGGVADRLDYLQS